MGIFIFCAYVILVVSLCVITSKHNKLTRELIDALVEENNLLADQNKQLRDVIKKYGVKTES
jgi:hypothetical protein